MTPPIETTEGTAAGASEAKDNSKKPKEGGPPKGEKKPKKAVDGADAAAHSLELNPKPAYFDSRIEIFDKLKKIQDERIAG